MYIVFRKNILLDLKTPWSLAGELLLQVFTCLLIYARYCTPISNSASENPLVVALVELLMPFYFGNSAATLIRRFSVYFINEREEHFKTYQIVLGLSWQGYLIGNLLYMYVFTSAVLTPVFLFLMYFTWNWTLVYYFAAFVLCQSNLHLALLTFFKDPKIASEIISMLLNISFFAYYAVDFENIKCTCCSIQSTPT